MILLNFVLFWESYLGVVGRRSLGANHARPTNSVEFAKERLFSHPRYTRVPRRPSPMIKVTRKITRKM